MKSCAGLLLSLFGVSVVASAESIEVPNFSFEMPAVQRDAENPYGALPWIDDWDEMAPGPNDEMDQNTGVFLNTDPTSFDHVTNAHLERLAFLSSLMGNDLRQVLVATFVPGRRYRLKVGVCKSSYLPVGADEKLEIALYYVDENVEHIIASSFITGSEVGSTFLTDLRVITPLVDANDAWAGQPIGILIRPALDDLDETGEGGEGMWDVDNVRLKAFEPIAGDFNTDGDVDADDYAFLHGCWTGPAVSVPVGSGCGTADLDGDGDVDQSDFGLLQANWTGPE